MRKKQNRIYYLFICILFFAGITTAYQNAKNFAEQAASIEAVRLYQTERSEVAISRLKAPEKCVIEHFVFVLESSHRIVHTMIGRMPSESSQNRREWNRLSLFLFSVCAVLFMFHCYFYMKRQWCLSEKKHQTVLIRYIHDMDGKKEIPFFAKTY